MGKGGTRFVGEAIAHRSGRAKSTYTNKELKKNMEKFLETGVHPDLERAKQVRAVQQSGKNRLCTAPAVAAAAGAVLLLHTPVQLATDADSHSVT
jgi:hypothetical protein